MAPTDFKVIIAGAGIGGLSLAIFLEKAKIDYVVLERSSELNPLGSTLSLAAMSLRVFDQLGLMDEIEKASIPIAGFKYFNQSGKLIGRMDVSMDDINEKLYGYNGIFFHRPDFTRFLLAQIPRDKILFGKKVIGTVQDERGVKCICSDSSSVEGSILIGADGAYSVVRQSMFKNMKESGIELPAEDEAPMKFDQYGILGVTEPIEGLPMETDGGEGGWMLTYLCDKETDSFVYVIHLPGNRLGWRIGGKMLANSVTDPQFFRYSDWDDESIDDLKNELSNRPAPLVGKIGVLFEKTKLISRVVLEEKMFKTWYNGRTVLLGDACHKMLPAAGQGANQTILDAVVLANLLYELPSDSVEDITRVFSRYYEIRASFTGSVLANSSRFGGLLSATGFMADLKRNLFFNWIPLSVKTKGLEPLMGFRPLLNYVPPIPNKGLTPDLTPLMTLEQEGSTTKTESIVTSV